MNELHYRLTCGADYSRKRWLRVIAETHEAIRALLVSRNQ